VGDLLGEPVVGVNVACGDVVGEAVDVGLEDMLG